MDDKNHIYEELDGTNEGIFKKENDLYNELLEFEKNRNQETLPQQNNIIDFFAPDTEPNYNPAYPLKLAAESADLYFQKHDNKSAFLISATGDFALKYSKKESEEICFTLLTSNDIDTDEVILFSKELNKYFISNSKGEYIIGQYASFDIYLLNFKAVRPFDKIIIMKDNQTYSIISLNNFSVPELLEHSDSILRLTINSSIVFSIAVIQNGKTKDSVIVNEGIVEIPTMLLTNKTTLYLY